MSERVPRSSGCDKLSSPFFLSLFIQPTFDFSPPAEEFESSVLIHDFLGPPRNVILYSSCNILSNFNKRTEGWRTKNAMHIAYSYEAYDSGSLTCGIYIPLPLPPFSSSSKDEVLLNSLFAEFPKLLS